MDLYDQNDAFEEDAISFDEVMGACDRFIAFRDGDGLAFRLAGDEDDSGVRLISRAEVLHFLEEQLESGAQVQVA